MSENIFSKARITGWETQLLSAFPQLNAEKIFADACTILKRESCSVDDCGNNIIGMHIRKNILPSYACYRALLDSGVDSLLAITFIEAAQCLRALHCILSHVSYDPLAPSVVFTPKATLANGSKVCDFCFSNGRLSKGE